MHRKDAMTPTKLFFIRPISHQTHTIQAGLNIAVKRALAMFKMSSCGTVPIFQ
jgi:hypothetical protein